MTIPRNLSKLAEGADTNGVLGVSYGGTGATSLTANNVVLGNGTSAVQFVAPSTSGNVLTSNGTTWTSSTPASPVATGTIISSAASTAPSGYLACDGSTYLQSSYSSLASTIGTVPVFQTTVLNIGGNYSIGGSLWYVNGNIIASGFYSSDSGATWTALGSNYSYNNAVWTGTYYVNSGGASISNNVTYRTSLNGAGTTVNLGAGYSSYGGLVWTGSRVIVFPANTTNTIYYSTNGTSYSAGTTMGTNNVAREAVYGSGIVVVSARNNSTNVPYIATTTDGTSITTRSLPVGISAAAGVYYRLAFVNNLFVLVDSLGAVASSSDGINWTLKAAAYTLNTITGFNQGPYLNSFNSYPSPTSGGQAVLYINGFYFTGNPSSASGVVFYSSDLITWKTIPIFLYSSSTQLANQPNGYFTSDGTKLYFSGGGNTCPTTANNNAVSVNPVPYNTGTQFVVPNLTSLQAPNQYYYIKT